MTTPESDVQMADPSSNPQPDPDVQMADPSSSSNPQPDPKSNTQPSAPDMLSVCPFGIINMLAVQESYHVLLKSNEDIHRHLSIWLAISYLDLDNEFKRMSEPLGRRIRSRQDLAMLVGAHDQARKLLKARTGNRMRHRFFFYEQGATREEGFASALWLQNWFKQKLALARLKEWMNKVEDGHEESEGSSRSDSTSSDGRQSSEAGEGDVGESKTPDREGKGEPLNPSPEKEYVEVGSQQEDEADMVDEADETYSC